MKMTGETRNNDSTETGWTFWLVFASLTVTASASFAIGYGIGAPNLYTDFTEPFLRGNFHVCHVQREDVRKIHNCEKRNQSGDGGTETTYRELLNGLPQTIFIVGCFIGSLTGGFFSQPQSRSSGFSRLFTRRTAFHFNFPFLYVSCGLMMVGYFIKSPFMFYLSRLFHGYQSGMASVIVPVYINEIASKRIRGSVGVIHQFFLTFGILVAQLLAFGLAGYRTWAYGMSAVVLPCIVAHFLIPILPDSPEQLILVHKNKAGAIKALRKLRGVEDVSADVQLIQASSSPADSIHKEERLKFTEMLKSPRTKWAVVTSLVILLVQALCGINAIFFYSTKVFRTAGISEYNLPFANASAGFINVLATILAIYLIEKVGRKALLVYPMAGMLLVFVGMTAVIQINEKRQSAGLGIASVVLTVVFICLFALGLGPIGFIYPTEVIRQSGRDGVLRVGLCLNYAGNLLISLLFPAINAALRGYSFLLFCAIVACGLGVLVVKMPETKNRTIEQIEKFWTEKHKLPRRNNDSAAPLRQSSGPTV